MSNNAQAGAAVGVGEVFNTTDLTTFTGHSATGDLPGAMLYVGAAGTSTPPTSVTNANPLPISDAGGSITVDSATLATEATLVAASAKLPAALGQAAMAASLSVVIASNQSAVPISVASLPLPTGAATSANQATEIVSLASIDGKLPALVGGLVPITIAGQTGTVTVGVTGTVAVTGAFFQATQPVSIGGTVAVSGPLTDAQLRATAVPVSGTVAFSNTTIAVTNAGTFVVQATLAAETTKVIGTVNIAAAQTIAVTNAGTFAVQAAQSGTWNVGTVTTVTTLSTITNVVHVDDNAGSLTVDAPVGTPVFVRLSDGSAAITTLPVSLASVPSHAVTNAGTFAVQIDSGAMTSLALIDDVIFADDVTFTPETSKVAAIGMQADETATNSVDEGDIGCPRMTLDRKARVVDTPHTAGGLSVSSFLSTAAVQSTAVKASPGQVYAIEFFNVGATPMFVRLYNMTTAPAGGDNANIVWRGTIPGNTAGAGFVKTWDKGLEFTTGIGMRCTGAIADTDATALAANTVMGNVDFK